MNDKTIAPKGAKIIYRVGDRVRILRPKYVKRVGYPLVWYDLTDEVEKDPRTLEALRVLGFATTSFRTTSSLPTRFVNAVAMLRVAQRGFGGRERTIHYCNPDEVYNGIGTGSKSEVFGKRVVKTGTYFPPSGGYCSDGEYDYEPGGLDNCQTHVLLRVIGGEIEACNVEPA